MEVVINLSLNICLRNQQCNFMILSVMKINEAKVKLKLRQENKQLKQLLLMSSEGGPGRTSH